MGGAYLDTPTKAGAGVIPSLSCFLLLTSVIDEIPFPMPEAAGFFISWFSFTGSGGKAPIPRSEDEELSSYGGS